MVSGADYVVKVAGSEHLAMRIGLHNEYQSDVQGTANKPDDFKFLGTMVYGF